MRISIAVMKLVTSKEHIFLLIFTKVYDFGNF